MELEESSKSNADNDASSAEVGSRKPIIADRLRERGFDSAVSRSVGRVVSSYFYELVNIRHGPVPACTVWKWGASSGLSQEMRLCICIYPPEASRNPCEYLYSLPYAPTPA